MADRIEGIIRNYTSSEFQSLLRQAEKFSAGRGRRRSRLTTAGVWRSLLRAITFQTAAYLTVSIALTFFSFATVLPLCRHLLGERYGGVVALLLTLLLLSPCIRPIAMRKNHSNEAKYLISSGKMNLWLVRLVLLGKVLLAFAVIHYVVSYALPLWWGWKVLISLGALMLMLMSRLVKYTSIRIERTFRHNLRLREQAATLSYGRRLRGRDLQIARVRVPAYSRWGGRTLAQLHFGRTDRVHIAAILRGGHRINIPGGSNRVYPGDELEVVAGIEAVESMRSRSEHEVLPLSERSSGEHDLSIISIRLGDSSPLIGLTLQEADFRLRYHCMVVGVENAEGHLDMVQAKRQFASGDIVWVVGEQADLSMLEMIV